MPDLKELLGEELYEQVKPKLNDNHVLIDKKEGSWLPKDKFDSKNQEVKDLKDQIKERDTQLEGLKEKAKGNEALTAQIDELKQQNETTKNEYQQKLDQQAFDHTLDKSLTGAKAKNAKAVKGLLDTEKMKLDGESIIGLDDQLKSLKESDAYLFEQEDEGGGKPSFSTGQHQSSGGGDSFAKTLLGG